jgi:hypothetical protein
MTPKKYERVIYSHNLTASRLINATFAFVEENDEHDFDLNDWFVNGDDLNSMQFEILVKRAKSCEATRNAFENVLGGKNIVDVLAMAAISQYETRPELVGMCDPELIIETLTLDLNNIGTFMNAVGLVSELGPADIAALTTGVNVIPTLLKLKASMA